MGGRQTIQNFTPSGGHDNQYAPAIGDRVSPLHEAGPSKTIDELNSAVVL